MRTFIFFFCAVAFSFAPNNGFSQNAKILIKESKSISVEEIFGLIKDQTDYKFVYRHDLIKDAPKVAVEKGVIKAKTLLEKGLTPIQCTYEFSNKTVIVKKMLSLAPVQETFSITGIVKDEVGDALPGVTVYVTTDNPNLGANASSPKNFLIRGTETDFEGKFTLKVSVNQYLVAQHFGYITVNEKIESNTKKVYNFVLQESVNKLDEVVVTGYTRTQKLESTAAASKITKATIKRQVTANLDDKLEGLSPGLIINQVTGDGGQERLELSLRGQSTFNAPPGINSDETDDVLDNINSLNRQPLIVVDGFPYEGPFNDIDAETIETIDVLRDAAATAIWGVRASNGVVVITTKRGKTGAPTITYSSNITVGSNQDLHQYGLASSAATVNILNRFQTLSSSSPFGRFSNRAYRAAEARRLSDKYLRLNAHDQIWALYYSRANFNNPNGITAAERDTRLAALANNDVLGQFEDHLIRGGFITQNSLNINGGSSYSKYSFTTTFTDEEQPNVGDSFNRLNLSLTSDFKLDDKFSFVVDAAISSDENRDNGIGVASLFTSGSAGGPGINVFDTLIDGSGNPASISNVLSIYQNDFLNDGFDNIAYNPILDQRLRNNKNTSLNLRLALGLSYKIFNGKYGNLSTDIKYQYNRITGTLENFKGLGLYETRNNNNSYITSINTGNGVQRAVPYGGTLERNEQLRVNNILRGSLNYEWANKFQKFTALLGMELSETTSTVNKQHFVAYNDRTGLYDVNFDHSQFVDTRNRIRNSVLGGSFRNLNLFTPQVIDRSVSTFANATYSYLGKYIIGATGKIDQTTAFGINERLSKPLLWAISGAWNIDREDFFKSDWLNTLKFRVSYGENGNLRQGLTTRTTIQYFTNDRLNNGDEAVINVVGNPNLKFERTKTLNFGLDFRVFKRISGTIDVYNKRSVDLLSLKNVNATLGQTSTNRDAVFTNNGEILNQGIELQLGGDVIRTDNFTWNTNLNYSYNKNEVISYGFERIGNAFDFINDVNTDITQIEGHPISARARYRWAGLDANGNPQVYNDQGQKVGYTSPEADLPTKAGLEITKPFIAPHYGGMTNTINYKNFSLSFLMTYKFGHVFEESLRNKYPYAGNGDSFSFHKDVETAWQNPGDENSTDIPAIPRNLGETNVLRRQLFEYSNLGIQDAAHIRLRDITLGYNLDSALMKKVGFSNVNFTFQMRNLGLLWTANNKDIDPESVPFSGREITFAGNFPRAYRPGIRVPISYVFGVKLNF